MLKPDPAQLRETAILNEKLVRSDSSLKKISLEKIKRVKELEIKKAKALALNTEIEKKKITKNKLDLELKNSSIELENLSNSLDLGNNLSFSSGFLNKINNRSRKTNNNKSDFVSRDIDKREYSTLSRSHLDNGYLITNNVGTTHI
jgi:hypothetical protein